MRLTIEVKNLNETRKFLASRNWLDQSWRRGLEGFASRAGLAAQRGAPVQTGHLQGKIRTAVQKKSFPTWIAIRSRAVTRSRAYPSGYPYPRLLAFSAKHGHKDWLINAVRPIWNSAGDALNKIGADIARNWSR